MIKIEFIDKDSHLHIEKMVDEKSLFLASGDPVSLANSQLREVVEDISEIYPNHSVSEAIDEFLTIKITQV